MDKLKTLESVRTLGGDEESELDQLAMNLESITNTISIWAQFKSSPKELWILLLCRFIEVVCFVSEDYVFILMLTKEFSFTNSGAGKMYSVIALSTFFYGLFISGFLLDRYGVRVSLIVGSLSFSIARLLCVMIVDKFYLITVLATFLPFAISSCKSSLLNF